MSVSRRATVLLLSFVLSVGGGASSAFAQSGSPRPDAPPGNSAVDQYRESLPPTSGNARELSRREHDRLAREGRDGEQLARALDRSGGVPRSSTTGDENEQTPRGATTPERSSESASTASGAPTAADGGDRAAAADHSELDTQSIAPAAAASTVGPVPVWVLLVAAAGLVGIGLSLRTRAAR